MRRYLDAVFGNTALKERLGKSIENECFSHALIIEGAKGSGKKTLATEIAAALVCEHRADKTVPLPCKKCRACELVYAHNAPDITWIGKGDKATLGVDAVRLAKQDMYLSSTEFDSKIYIFTDAHDMTVQAQNALLIFLEEPPAHVKIMLLCEQADGLLTTVRSRARPERMEKFTTAQMREWLENNAHELMLPYRQKPETADAVLCAADGRIGEALRLLSPENADGLMKERALTDTLLAAMAPHAPYSALQDAVSALPFKREELIDALSLWLTAVRDLILLKQDEHAPCLYMTDREKALKQAELYRTSALLHAADLLDGAIRQMEHNANTATVLALLKCALKGK